MKLFGSHGALTHPHRAKERDRFISSSLTSSSDLSKRLITSSSDRSRPHAMRFHEQWRHEECPVFKWYTLQTQSPTTFSSIQHWRNKQGPFFHEYLLILLDDGSICRLERMGEGSRRHAIKRIGCVAHDIIQWFAPSTYETDPVSREPAEMLYQVDFPRTFDLIDVLAICWSIQRTRRCAAYTLQRYNCYFLCLTILATLARRIEEWERVVDSEAAWSIMVDDAIGYLRQTSCDDPDEYVGLGICEIVNPGHPDPRGFILDSLRSALSTNGLEGWKTSVSETLWVKDIETAIKRGLSPSIKTASELALDGNDTCATELRLVLDFDENVEDDCTAHGISDEFLEAFRSQVIIHTMRALSDMVESAETARRMQDLEYKPALRHRLAAWTFAPIGYLAYYVIPMGGQRMLNTPDESEWVTRSDIAIMRWLRRNPSTCLPALAFTMLIGFDDNILAGFKIDPFGGEAFNSAAKQQILQSPLCSTRLTKLYAMRLNFDREGWLLAFSHV